MSCSDYNLPYSIFCSYIHHEEKENREQNIIVAGRKGSFSQSKWSPAQPIKRRRIHPPISPPGDREMHTLSHTTLCMTHWSDESQLSHNGHKRHPLAFGCRDSLVNNQHRFKLWTAATRFWLPANSCVVLYIFLLKLRHCHLCWIKMLPFSRQDNYFAVDNIFVLCPSPTEEVDTVRSAPTLLDHEFSAVIVHAIF